MRSDWKSGSSPAGSPPTTFLATSIQSLSNHPSQAVSIPKSGFKRDCSSCSQCPSPCWRPSREQVSFPRPSRRRIYIG
jgi:hypothetical protein